MFGRLSYVAYTLLFGLPPLLYMWGRQKHRRVLRGRLRAVVLATLVLTGYGALCWPVALELGCWAYGPDRFTGIQILGWVYLDDLLWWILMGLDFGSFLALATHHRDRGRDVVVDDARELLRLARRSG